jgi:prephenate dehydrogenase
MEARAMIRTCVIAGANGGFGRLLGRLLGEAGVEVVGIDLGPDPAPCTRYLAADLTRPDDLALAEVARADALMLCLPEEALDRALGRLIGTLSPGALLVDTTSVKTPYARAIAAHPADCEVLSLNPMFAPEVGFASQDVAAVRIRPGPRSSLFEGWIAAWGGRVVPLSAEEHDRQAGMCQVAAHAAILAYGLALDRLGYDPDRAITTPPQRILLGLVARVAARDPDVYWHIQRDNPFAAEARRAIIDGLERIDRLALAGGRDAFHEAFRAVAAILPGSSSGP